MRPWWLPKYNHKNFMEFLALIIITVLAAGAMIGIGYLKKAGYISADDNAPGLVVGGLTATLQTILLKIFRIKPGQPGE